MPTEFFQINGLRVANIHSDSELAMFGIAVLAGSNYETPNIAGISHYAEHMFFKGTKKRDWNKINKDFARLGISQNAYTDNNEVFYFSLCPKDNVEGSIEILMDMFFNSTFPEDEIEKERSVILEEKKMGDDKPKSDFYTKIGMSLFNWEKGHPIIGFENTIKSISRNDIINYLNEKLSYENMLFVCSGNIDSAKLAKYISKRLPKRHPYLKSTSKNIVANSGLFSQDVQNGKKNFVFYRPNIKQAYISMIVQGLGSFDKNFCNMVATCRAIGGGMYSILFSRIREELGLCYSVGVQSFTMDYPNNTMLDIYGSTSPDKYEEFILECNKAIRKTMRHGLSNELFECAKNSYLADILKSTETSMGKVSVLLGRYLQGNNIDVEDVQKAVKKVNKNKCNDVLHDLFSKEPIISVMLPEKK